MNRQKKNILLPVPRLLGMPFAQGVALLYLLVAGLWIYFSDKLAEWLTETASQLRFLSTYKGWFFVAVTAGLLFLVLKRFVSKIRLAQQKLRENEDRFKIATEAGGIGVWDRDIVNDRLLWDDRMYELYGVHKEDFGGAYDAWKQCLHPDDIDRASVEVAAAERGGKPLDTEFRIIRPDGEVRHIRAFGKVIRDETGRPVRMTGTNQDITDHKQAEQQVQSQLNELNRWHQVTLGREMRILELKKEINELLKRMGEPPRYSETADSLQKDTSTPPRL
jgi:PAS domain S-box-containing protein